MEYLIEGRLISDPKSAEFSDVVFPLELCGQEAVCLYSVVEGNVKVVVRAVDSFAVRDLQNVVKWGLSTILNLVGFYRAKAITFHLEKLIVTSTGQEINFNEDAFPDTTFAESETFRPHLSIIEFHSDLLKIPALSIATHNLRCAIVYPDYTAAHCRTAIEAIKNYFDPDQKSSGWSLLKSNLNVDEQTVASWLEDAHHLRHGKMLYQTWQQREHAMKIAWEVCNRFIKWHLAGATRPLNASEFPLL